MVREALRVSSSLSFVRPVQVLPITHAGMKYCDDRLGLCVSIPEGAVPEGLILHLEVGMCLHGPFKFPANTSSIAPILLLYPQENITLQKCIKITLPHIIDCAQESDVETLGIQVVKADHILGAYPETHLPFSFVDTDSKIVFEQIGQNENFQNYATFSLTHFCFLSLRVNKKMKSEVAKRKAFCVSPLYPTRVTAATPAFTYHFPITYYMDPWLEV